MAAAPYATGGGGTVLEHRYGAVVLASLLSGDPIPELGDDAKPISVHFQASSSSPVDDLLIVGRTQDGEERRVPIGVRRAPKLVQSNDDSVRLLAQYLRIVTDHWGELQAGRWRLCLAYASPNDHVSQLDALAEIARTSADEARFRAEVSRPGRTRQAVRRRLSHVDGLRLVPVRGSRQERHLRTYPPQARATMFAGVRSSGLQWRCPTGCWCQLPWLSKRGRLRLCPTSLTLFNKTQS